MSHRSSLQCRLLLGLALLVVALGIPPAWAAPAKKVLVL